MRAMQSFSRTSAPCQGRHSRSQLLVRCTAVVEPSPPSPAPSPSSLPAPVPVPAPAAAVAPAAAPVPGLAPRSGAPAPRSTSPRRGPGRRLPDTASSFPAGPARRRDAGEAASSSNGGMPAGERQPSRRTPRLPELSFLEDDEDLRSRASVAMYRKYLSSGQGVVVRCLGRAGVASAVKYVVALRQQAAAAAAGGQQQAAGSPSPSASPVDVRFRLRRMEPVLGFGSPLVLLVDPVKGEPARAAVPDLHAQVKVSAKTEYGRLDAALVRVITELPVGHYVRMEMVGNDALFRGLMALSNACGELGKVGANLVITPELVTAPVRVSQPQQPAAAGGAPAAGSSSSSGEGAAASEPQAEAGQAAAMVQVVHLYITKPRKGQQAEAKGAQDGKRQEAAAAEAAASSAAPVAASAPAGGAGEITVPRSEWEALKGAVGDMMQQQQVLTNLLVARQQQQLQGQVQQ